MILKDVPNIVQLHLKDAILSEINYIRSLGSHNNLILMSANLSAYEALLSIIGSGECGMPVYQAVASVKSGYSTQSGVLMRLKIMREQGLVEERLGLKRSQVCLAPSQKLLNQLGPILIKRHNSLF